MDPKELRDGLAGFGGGGAGAGPKPLFAGSGFGGGVSRAHRSAGTQHAMGLLGLCGAGAEYPIVPGVKIRMGSGGGEGGEAAGAGPSEASAAHVVVHEEQALRDLREPRRGLRLRRLRTQGDPSDDGGGGGGDDDNDDTTTTTTTTTTATTEPIRTAGRGRRRR